MPEIRPIKDLTNTTKISELCHEVQEPIFITNNGYEDLVVMSMDTYKQKIAQSDLYKKLAEAELQIESNESLLDAENVLKKLRKKHEKE